MAENDKFIRINIGGKGFEIRRRHAITKGCETTLLDRFVRMDHAERLQICDYLPDTKQYYFERSPKAAEPLIDCFMTGFLHKPTDLCAERFHEELKYWNVPQEDIAICCRSPPVIKITETEIEATEDEQMLPKMIKQKDPFEGKYCAKYRRILWNLCENKQSTLASKFYAVVSIGFVLLSVTGLVLGSMPELQTFPENSLNNSTEEAFREGEPLPIIGYMEYICVAWFAVEYSLRLAISPKKMEFLTSPMNLVDLFTILPFGLEMALPWMGYDLQHDGFRRLSGAMLVMRVLRVLRVARVFKLARYSKGLQGFGDTMGRSVHELSMLSMFLFTGITFFSTLLYFLEKDIPGSKFRSIPESGWWCVVTMTTVGYGDLVPSTWGGKMVAAATSVCGIVVLAFPISMIVDKFVKHQEHDDRKQRSHSEAP